MSGLLDVLAGSCVNVQYLSPPLSSPAEIMSVPGSCEVTGRSMIPAPTGRDGGERECDGETEMGEGDR